jgi:hypothetical protein
MAGVFRSKETAFSKATLTGYAIHGTTALLALWLFAKAAGY